MALWGPSGSFNRWLEAGDIHVDNNGDLTVWRQADGTETVLGTTVRRSVKGINCNWLEL
jgi:hypothetical protein